MRQFASQSEVAVAPFFDRLHGKVSDGAPGHAVLPSVTSATVATIDTIATFPTMNITDFDGAPGHAGLPNATALLHQYFISSIFSSNNINSSNSSSRWSCIAMHWSTLPCMNTHCYYCS